MGISSPGYALDESYYQIKIYDVLGGNNVKYQAEKHEIKYGVESVTMTLLNTAASPVTIDMTSSANKSYEPPKYWSLNLLKESANNTLTDGNSCYSVDGAEYTLYYGTSTSISKASVFTKDMSYSSGTCANYIYTYEKAVTCSGFKLGMGKIVGVTFSYSLNKTPAGENLTLNVNRTGAYPIYYNGASFDSADVTLPEGVVYFEFDGSHWNILCSSAVTSGGSVYTTDENGYLMTGMLPVASGYYFLKETKASKGYELDTSYWRIKVSDVSGGNNVKYSIVKYTKSESGAYTAKTLHSINDAAVESPALIDLTTEAGRSYEPPANDPFALTLSKKGTVGESINGAIFELTYYDNTDGKATGDPYNTWYFMTKNGGKLDCNNVDYLVDGKFLNDKVTYIESDELYHDTDNASPKHQNRKLSYL